MLLINNFIHHKLEGTKYENLYDFFFHEIKKKISHNSIRDNKLTNIKGCASVSENLKFYLECKANNIHR